MGAGMLIGALLVAFGPAVAVFLTYVWNNAAMLILALSSALAAYVWTLLTSFFWLAVPPLQGKHAWPLVIGPLVAEAVRAAFFVGYMRIERAADRMTSLHDSKVFIDLPSALAAGSGAGLLVTIMRYGAALTVASGRAAWYYPTCPAMSAFILNSFTSLFTNFLHMALSVLVLDALRRKSWGRGTLPVAIHVAFSAVGAATEVQDGCVAVLPVQVIVLAVAWACCWFVVRAPDYSARRQLRAWAAVQQHARQEWAERAGSGRQAQEGQGTAVQRPRPAA